jgi:hypothetical protein
MSANNIRMYARINFDSNAPGRCGVAAVDRLTGGGQQTSMGKRIRHSGNRYGCLYFTKPLIVRKEEGAIMHQRSSYSRAELVAHKRRDRTGTQIKVVPRIE